MSKKYKKISWKWSVLIILILVSGSLGIMEIVKSVRRDKVIMEFREILDATKLKNGEKIDGRTIELIEELYKNRPLFNIQLGKSKADDTSPRGSDESLRVRNRCRELIALANFARQYGASDSVITNLLQERINLGC